MYLQLVILNTINFLIICLNHSNAQFNQFYNSDELNERYINDEWEEFKDEYNKEYSDDEETYRYSVFKNNLKIINDHNNAYERGVETFSMGINGFSDQTDSEFYDRMSIKDEMDQEELDEGYAFDQTYLPDHEGPLPKSIDWRKKGAISQLKIQHHCGACYAFAATGSIEAQYYLKYHNKSLVEFSEQNLVDCATRYGTHGCHGGYAHLAFRYIIKNGIHLEDDYPYVGGLRECKKNVTGFKLKLKDYEMIKRGDEQLLKEFVALYGPVAISYRVTHKFRHHKYGVFYAPKCSDHTNHAMLIVGYGTENGKDYWIVKNTWGKHFAESGFAKIARNMNNNCGVARRAVVPVLF